MKVLFSDLTPNETPIDDCSGLLVPAITSRSQLNVVEAQNIRLALLKYFRKTPTHEIAPFDLNWIKELHREMYGNVWSWAGEFRKKDLSIGCPWLHIQERLYNLLEDLRAWDKSGLDLLEQSARLHHSAVQVHPFENGNGRWSRLLANIWLAIHGEPYVAWPEKTIGTTSPIRDAYIMALKAADLGDLDPFIEMHRKYAQNSTRL
jgi:Fic-DOC domain mobile mystery protein B